MRLSKVIASKTVLAGILILGTTGGLIGYHLGEGRVFIVLPSFILGALLGASVGILGGRIFFTSVIFFSVLVGYLGYRAGGWDVFEMTAGTGAAMGGFIGIFIENLIRQRRGSNENRALDTKSGW